jgi:hypothetical protein
MAKSKASTAQNTEQNAPKKVAIAAVRKITVASVFGKVKVADILEGEEIALCRIAGVASGLESGESSYGPWTMLLGEFAATNYQTGEIFAGVKAIVPGAMGEQLVLSMTNALMEDAGSKLKFSVDIFAKVSPRDANKYEYVVRPVLAPDVRNEAMALLEWSDAS